MYNPKEIMEKRELKDVTFISRLSDFPRNEEIPEGCIVLDGLTDSWGYPVDVHTDVVYVTRSEPEDIPLHLHIIVPKGHFEDFGFHEVEGRPWPCVVYIPGSAFHQQDMWSVIGSNLRLAQKGFAVAIVEYRPSETAPFPAQMQDAKTAIRYMRKHAKEYGIDPERIAVAGDSSGGHSALMAGFTGDELPDTEEYSEFSAKVRCIVDYYGPTVFSLMNYCDSFMDHIQPDSPEGFEIGLKNVLEHPELVAPTIPMNYLSEEKATPPTLIIHGGRDMLVNFDQSCQLYSYMKKLGKDVTFYKINDAGHGCNGFLNDTVLDITVDYLKKHL